MNIAHLPDRESVEMIKDISEPSSTMPPWQREPYRLWSRIDMVSRFDASLLSLHMTRLERAISHAEMILSPPPRVNSNSVHLVHGIEEYRTAISGMLSACTDVGLSSAVQLQLQRLLHKIDTETFKTDYEYTSLMSQARTARQSVIDDLGAHVFLYIDPQNKELIEQESPPFGQEVIAVFPEARRDIEAAARCLALEENTACVFHLMRALEYGLRGFAVVVGVDSEGLDLENWKNIIDRIESKIRAIENEKRSQSKSERAQVFSEAASEFRHFKDAWRNSVSHAKANSFYDNREARKVFEHVQTFMQLISRQNRKSS